MKAHGCTHQARSPAELCKSGVNSGYIATSTASSSPVIDEQIREASFAAQKSYTSQGKMIDIAGDGTNTLQSSTKLNMPKGTAASKTSHPSVFLRFIDDNEIRARFLSTLDNAKLPLPSSSTIADCRFSCDDRG